MSAPGPAPERPGGPLARMRASTEGIVVMSLGVGLLAINDACVKLAAPDLPLATVLAVRGAIATAMIVAVIAWRRGPRELRFHSPARQLLRGGLMALATWLVVYGYTNLPLADTYALFFAAPLFITAMAPRALGERVDAGQWGAVVVGFAGILVMVRTTGEGIGWLALAPLGGALASAVKDVFTRRMSLTETTGSMLLAGTAVVTVTALPAAIAGWRTPGPEAVAVLAVAGAFQAWGQFLMIEAFRLAEAAVVGPLHYTGMVWAIAIGWLTWGDVPDAGIAAGSALVIGSGLYIFHRDVRRPPPESARLP